MWALGTHSPRHPYPKAHRYLLLNLNGRIPSPTINYLAFPSPSQPPPQEFNVSSAHPDTCLADIHRLLSNHSEMLRHLYDLLGG